MTDPTDAAREWIEHFATTVSTRDERISSLTTLLTTYAARAVEEERDAFGRIINTWDSEHGAELLKDHPDGHGTSCFESGDDRDLYLAYVMRELRRAIRREGEA